MKVTKITCYAYLLAWIRNTAYCNNIMNILGCLIRNISCVVALMRLAVMGGHMTLHIRPNTKWFATYTASVWFLSRMYSSMILQIASGSKAFATKLALVISLSSMDSSMNNKTVLASEVFPTEFTLILSDIGMY